MLKIEHGRNTALVKKSKCLNLFIASNEIKYTESSVTEM